MLVMRGIVKRFAIASARKAFLMVEPFWDGSGWMEGLVAGDLEDMLLFW